MRFQQLKRNPNAIMRKKLVKSKKAWVVVSSLSIAGGLLLMTTPSYVAKADATTTAPVTATESVTKAASDTLTPAASSTSATNEKNTSSDTPTTPSASNSETTDNVGTDNKLDTQVQNTENSSDASEETVTTVKEKAVDDTSVEKVADTANETTQPATISLLSASEPENTTKAAETPTELTTADTSAQKMATEIPATENKDVTVTNSDLKDETVKDPAITNSNLLAEKDSTDATLSTAALVKDAAVTPIAPVVEDTVVPANSGNGWNYDSSSTTLNITGQLDESDGTDKERWGGHTSEISTINVQNPIVAPKDSSYLFANMTNLTQINNLKNLQFVDNDSNPITRSTEGMFKNDSSLKTIDLSGNNLRNIYNISHMFENDSSLEQINFSNDAFKKIVNGSYAFANDTSLKTLYNVQNVNYSSTNTWMVSTDTSVSGTRDLRGMFKNDSSLDTIYITTWAWPAGTLTGNSYIGEGMFDGTDLQSIKLNSNLKFDSHTALTSNKGINWTESTFNQSFSGIPTFDANGKQTGGLGFLYDGNADRHIKGSTDSDPVADRMLLYVANGIPDTNTTVTNLVTIHVTHDGITSDITTTATGKYGSKITINDFPKSISFDSSKPDYTTQIEQVDATLGLTQTVANEVVPYSLEAAHSGNVKINTSNGSTISIPVTATDTDTVGGTQTVTITNDQIKALVPGYHLANNSDSTSADIKFISPTTDNPTTVATSTDTIELVGDDISENPNGLVSTKQAGDVKVTIPAGSIGTPSAPITIEVPGYKQVTVIATTTVSSDGNNVVTYTTNDGKNTPITSDAPLILTGNSVSTSDLADNPIMTKQAGKTVPVSVTVPDGTVIGTPTTVTVSAPGYKDKQVKAVIAQDADGKYSVNYTTDDSSNNPITNDAPVALEGNPVTTSDLANNPIMTKQAGKDVPVSVTVPDGTVIGTPTTVTVSAPGYKDKQVKAVIAQDADGKYSVNYTTDDSSNTPITNDAPVALEGNPVTTSDLANNPIMTKQAGKDVPVSVTVPDGAVIGTPTTVTVSAPGYKDKQVKATIVQDADGKYSVNYTTDDNSNTPITNDAPVALEGNPVTTSDLANNPVMTKQAGKDVPVSVTVPDGAVIGTPTTVTVSAPGYKDKQVKATIVQDADNKYSVNYTTDDSSNTPITNDDPVALEGNPVTTSDLANNPIMTKQGNSDVPVSVTVPDGTVIGTPTTVTVSAPGYKDKQVKAVIAQDADGKYSVNYTTDDSSNKPITDNAPVALEGETVPSDTKIDPVITKQGNSDVPVTITIPDGTVIGTPTEVTVSAPGYKDSKVMAVVSVDKDGKYSVTYTTQDGKAPVNSESPLALSKVSSGGSSSVKPNVPNEGTIEHKTQTISTYSDKPDVELYQLGADNKMAPITSRYLATASNWYSDATITIDGISYFRVATNEWAKAGEVYPYQALNLHIRTYDDSEKELYKAENVLITRETLAPDSSWITDRETYVINNTKYYRVATNEFVNADDVYVYSPVNMVVTTHADKYTPLYTAKGAAVTNRTLSNNTSWKVDSIAYINGDKYYRVATNEFVKASDVDIKSNN